MLDIGWSEIAIIAVVALFVIGPRELPKALGTMGRYIGKIRAMAREFQSSIEDAVRDSELDEVRKEIKAVSGKGGMADTFRKAIDPTDELRDVAEVAKKATTLPKSIDVETKPKTEPETKTETAAPAVDKAEPAAAPPPPSHPPSSDPRAAVLRPQSYVPAGSDKPAPADKPAATDAEDAVPPIAAAGGGSQT